MSFSDPRRNPYYSKYVGKTGEIRRPTGNEAEFRLTPDHVIHQHVEAWDAAQAAHESRVASYASIAAKRATEEATERQQRAKREAEARAKADAAILDPALAAFKRSGGIEAEFEPMKAEILAASRRAAALQAATKVAAFEEPRPDYSRL